MSPVATKPRTMPSCRFAPPTCNSPEKQAHCWPGPHRKPSEPLRFYHFSSPDPARHLGILRSSKALGRETGKKSPKKRDDLTDLCHESRSRGHRAWLRIERL